MCDQTLRDIEIIVVNDGSTNDTARIVLARAALDRRIRLVNQANGGNSAARNAGMMAARAPWVALTSAS